MKARNETETIMGESNDPTRTIIADRADGATTVQFDRQEAPLGVQVISAVGAATGMDETEITEPLHEAIDPEALDRLFPRNDEGSVQFSFDGHLITIEVTADGTGTVAVQ